MTDVAYGTPAQPGDGASTTATPSQPTVPAQYGATTPLSTAGTEQSTVDEVRERAAEFATDVRQRAGEAFDQAGEALSGAVDKAKETAGTVVTRLRNNASLPAERGKTTIANEVVEKIAGIAAREVPGVYDLGGDAARLFSSVKERLHLGEESAAQGVSVTLEGRTAEIEIVIVIEFGFVVYSVTEKVREKVISSVENLLGLEVLAVDVTVDDVHINDDGPVGDDEARAAGYSAETKAIVVGAPATS